MASEMVAKPLKWRYDQMGNNGVYVAGTPFGQYSAWQVYDDWWWVYADDQRKQVASYEEAQAAAQADYQARVSLIALSD